MSGSDCGCCAGLTSATPEPKYNAPGQSALAYRIGAYGDFKSSLQARMSSDDFPALAKLRTRSDDDWTVAVCDAFSCMADVLTFYQERIVNESYLRTASERRSVLELARLIGYKLAPGVAASTALAFTLDSAPGQPSQASLPSVIPVGTRVQSVPDPGQQAQTFETTAAITARAEWNAIPAQTSVTQTIGPGHTELYIAGTNNSIQPGDAILIVGRERASDVNSDRWDVRWLDTVEVDSTRGITRLAWSEGLGKPLSPPSAQGTQVYVFRQRASLFGSNAPDANLVVNSLNSGSFTSDKTQWLNFNIDPTGKSIDLDAAYSKIVPQSWFALAGGSGGNPPIGYVELYRVVAASQLSRTDFGLSAKITRLQSDGTENLKRFDLRATQVLVQSELLSLAQQPLTYPVYGDSLTLGQREPGIQSGQLIALSGKRQRVAIPADTTGISFSDQSKSQLVPGDSFMLLAAPKQQNAAGQWTTVDFSLPPVPSTVTASPWCWSVLDHDGTPAIIESPAFGLAFQAALQDDDVLSEVVVVASGAGSVSSDLYSTTLALATKLANCYDRLSVAVNANVAPTTHGETVSEVAGSGDSSQLNQQFQLKQSPLTYVSSSSDPSGAAATLQVQINGLRWSEQPTLYGNGPKDRVYTLSQDDSGTTTVAFGDGIDGARLPTAQNNVSFIYRKGLGATGNLRNGQINMLLTRPAGVMAAANPVAASGGQDPETLDQARQNAPVHVLTLDRAVSVQDYADFTRTFAGIGKVYATWIGAGLGRGMHLTVAGVEGAKVDPNGATQTNLAAALYGYGDPLLPLDIQSYLNVQFGLQVAIAVATDADNDVTIAAVRAALLAAYAFDARDFGQPVTLDGLYAVVQSVTGVVASDISQLYRGTDPSLQLGLTAALPSVRPDGTVTPAELLTIAPALLSLSPMT